MRVTGKLIGPFIFAVALLVLSRIFVFGASTASAAQVLGENDDIPNVTARVARISYLSGDAQIKRSDGGEWEKATLNLPVVEGDEIATSDDARLEIQFGNDQHLRLADNAYLKITSLKDEGIALSLSLGTMSVSIKRFDKDKTFFEIDAPRSTIAVQKAGIYRIDAGQAGGSDIRISVTDDGEARVYSESVGFTLKNGRSALVHIDGANAGEWEAGEASRFADEFDTWSLERDAVIAQRLKDAYYDKYYDSDIYGADDLNGNGEWMHTTRYGYVWRPYQRVTSYYADWSPYRYGHWRWIPPFGWTWINDEPWGWATYHYGRWFFDDGYWYWTPYGYHRYGRSWWFPALVVMNFHGSNIFWYPLGYYHAFYNFNHHYHSHHHHGGHHHGHGGHNQCGGGHQQPPPAPHQPVPPKIPANAVFAMAENDFGTTIKKPKVAPLSVANAVLTKKVSELSDPVMPAYTAVTKKITRDIAAEPPKADTPTVKTRVGAAPRKLDAPLDKELRKVRIFGGREPAKSEASDTRDPRKTGAVVRQPSIKQNDTIPTIKPAPAATPKIRTQNDTDVKPVRTAPMDAPVRQAPIKQAPPRIESQPTKQPPRSEPSKQAPVKSAPPKQESKPSPSKAST